MRLITPKNDSNCLRKVRLTSVGASPRKWLEYSHKSGSMFLIYLSGIIQKYTVVTLKE